MRRSLLSLLLLGLVATAQAAVTAHLDRQQSSLSSSVSLIIKATDGDDIGQPNLAPLQQDFRVLGQMSSSQTQIINFHTTQTKTLTIRLQPRHTGKLTIPPLHTAAGNTPQLALTVTDAAHNPQATANPNIFLRVSASPDTLYVGQQTTVTVKLFYSTRIDQGGINPPQLKQASIQPLGKSKQYTSQRNGKRYQVYEQQFALFPSQSGALTLPAFVFNGSRLTSQSSNFFGMQVPGFGRQTPVTAASQPLHLHVKPIPHKWDGMWLPAKQLSLSASGLPQSNTLTVGTPVNLTLTLQAKGLAADALPELSLPDINNASVYKDKMSKHSGRDGLLLTGKRQRRFAILPQQPGKLVIPATQLVWFNTQTQQKEVAKVPARTFTVVAGKNAPQATTGKQTATPTAANHSQPDAASSGSTTDTASTNNGKQIKSLHHKIIFWQRAFFASLVLWLLLVIGALMRRRKSTASTDDKPTPPSKRTLRRQFFSQLQQKDSQLLSTLLQWANSERDTITTREQLKAALIDEQITQILLLENWCYGGGAFPDTASSHFRKGLQWRDQQRRGKATDDSDMLPSLYPPDNGSKNT